MDCVRKNCNISDDDRMVSCWLCLGLCHLKCSGLKARDADALGDRTKCLQWTCQDCRPIGIEFYNFFRSYKSEFDEIQSDFLALKSKLDKYGELFSKFSSLNAISPKPKRKTSKQPTSSPGNPNVLNGTKVVDTAPSASDINIANKLSSHISKSTTAANTTAFFQKSLDSTQSNLNAKPRHTAASSQKAANSPSSNISLNPSNIPSQLQLNSAPTLGPVSNPPNKDLTPEFMVFSPLFPSNTEPNNNSVTLQQVNPSEPKPLRVIPPMKTLFATRFAPDTTVVDVEFYIKNNLRQGLYNNIKIFKINARNRASFKIIVPEDLFDHLVNPKFWPKSTIIKQFVYRNNDNVTLPSATETRSKN